MAEQCRNTWQNTTRAEVGRSVTVRQERCQKTPTKMSEIVLDRFPAFIIDDVSEHKPDLMPEQTSEHHVNPHQSPFRVGSLEVK